MTVGISITNGLEAVIITDTRASGQGRQSDSVNKMGEFSAENYSGVVFGTGIGTLIEGVIKSLADHKCDTFEEFMQSVHSEYRSRVNIYDSQILQGDEVEIRKKAHDLLPEVQLPDIKLRVQSLVDQGVLSEEQKEGAIRQELAEAGKKHDAFVAQQRESSHRDYDTMKKSHQTLFVFAAYDSSSERIRIYHMDNYILSEVHSSHVEIGSGSDGANLYFSTKLQGVSTQKLSLPDLAFFACNAYGISTVNQGVGGTPKIAHISKEGVNVLGVHHKLER